MFRACSIDIVKLTWRLLGGVITFNEIKFEWFSIYDKLSFARFWVRFIPLVKSVC